MEKFKRGRQVCQLSMSNLLEVLSKKIQQNVNRLSLQNTVKPKAWKNREWAIFFSNFQNLRFIHNISVLIYLHFLTSSNTQYLILMFSSKINILMSLYTFYWDYFHYNGFLVGDNDAFSLCLGMIL